jgi:hypothetical protein
MELFKLLSWDHLRNEWAVIKTAPLAFVVVILFGAYCGYQVASFRYEGQLQNLDTAGKSKDALIVSLREKQYDINNEQTTHQSRVRDPDGIYQFGKKVGDAIGIAFQLQNGMVLFQILSADGTFNPKSEFEFRDFSVKIVDVGAESIQKSFGAVDKQKFSAVKALVIRRL